MGLKIAITCPTCTPYVRRGAERYQIELARFLASKKHNVTIITSKPGKPKIKRIGNITFIYHKYLQHPLTMSNPRLRLHLFALHSLISLTKGKYDLIHNLYHSDGFASRINRSIKKTKYVFEIIIPPHMIIGYQNVDRLMFREAVKHADCVKAASRHMRRDLKDNWGYDSEVIPIPVDCSFFRPVSTRDKIHPRILFAGSLNDSRKNVRILIEAFNILIKKIPHAILQLSGQVYPKVRKDLLSRVHPDAKNSVHILGQGLWSELPKLYSEASVTVLPSKYEAQGMVLTESLACGTPVAGTNGGGIPEIISNPQIGTLFNLSKTHSQRNVTALCEAILNTLEISKNVYTVKRCRDHAKNFSWNVIGPKIENLYHAILSENP
jgi:glycosyltransferase involved in cell wall biosynthesis